MKVITKYVNIENEEFVLIYDEQNDKKFYGTIPYAELENGKMKRALNGFEMSIADTPAKALERRRNDIITDRKVKAFMSLGMSKEEALIKAIFA